MRVEEGSFRSKEDCNGTRFYLHRLAGGPPPAITTTSKVGPHAQRADADTLNLVYSALLDALALSDCHGEALHSRGLVDPEIQRRGYRSLPVHRRSRLAASLYGRFQAALLGVPGIITKQGERGPYLTIAGAAGLLVPIRDTAGRIVALLSRRDDASDGRGKYMYLSSTQHGGPGPGAPVHVPLGVTTPCPTCRVTEGALKADIAFALSSVPTIGAAGLAWRPASETLRSLECRTVRLAFDADAADKAIVARALAASSQTFDDAGLAVELERWPTPFKGIDDALAGGAFVDVLAGEDAHRAIAQIVNEGTAGEPLPPPGPLDRLAGVLADGGAETLFRDRELLQALAQLAESDPAEFVCRRAQLQRAAIGLRDLDKALSPLRKAIRRDRPKPDAAGQYRFSGGRIVRDAPTKDGTVEVPLAMFAARIVEETVRDDGAEQSVTLAVEGALADGTSLPRVEVPADEFPYMRWPVARWGTRAVVLAGLGTADHLRVALQLLSGDVPRRIVYAHTGWREINGRWFYLHAGGAIGGDGPAAEIAVCLPDALAAYALPCPPTGPTLVAAVRASLRILDLAPDRVTVSLLGGAYRAVLGSCDCALHLAGPTGTGKTELAALAQQHYGPGLDARHLPASWSSTGNALETLCFAGKDVLLVVDDFAPGGTSADVARQHREADRLLRAQGNRMGRMRLRADATLRPARPPRGLILSTGEDVPRGQSLRARLLTLEMEPKDMDWSALTDCQADATEGRYSEALAGYLRWLASRYSAIHDGLRSEVAELRERSHCERLHARTPGILADVTIGWRHWLDFAESIGAVSSDDRAVLDRRVRAAIEQAGAMQAGHLASAEPTGHFLRLLAGALASGRAHCATPEGGRPANPEAWGWRTSDAGCAALGRRIGWVDGDCLYLEPEASYAEAQEIARDQGDGLPVSPRTLRKRLSERGLLASTDSNRDVLTIRKTLDGRRREVLHLRADCLSATQPDQPDQSGGSAERNGRVSGQVSGRVSSEPSAHPTPKPDQNDAEDGDLVGLVGKAPREEWVVNGSRKPQPPPGARLLFADAHGRPCVASDAAQWTWVGGPRWFNAATDPPPDQLGHYL
jgi:hypothetical protein